jgi:hypothetical protein
MYVYLGVAVRKPTCSVVTEFFAEEVVSDHRRMRPDPTDLSGRTTPGPELSEPVENICAIVHICNEV